MAKRNKGTPADKVEETSEELFALHPKLDVYYQTSDGNQFYLEKFAQNHAQGLKNKTIQKTIKNN
ncbi:hypothetical protein [Pedobacter cryoconitis]|uniref:Uncharacterized protein n=1 Tax=Pedobacter cryoconitis TaxID=188932 RepID=A0A7X0J3R7_9SPHI|nr:hypothetical protein [Pedobacter cryoconitis]MBB6499121.1 hypothetical protein [Pedobacter cryoconitis]